MSFKNNINDFFFKNIQSITVTELNFSLKVKRKNEFFNFIISDVKKVYILSNKIKSFYFFDFISLLILGIVVVAFWLSLINLLYIGIVGIIFRGVYLIEYKKYVLILRLKNNKIYKYYLQKNEKYRVLEKVKLIREKMSDANFITENNDFKN